MVPWLRKCLKILWMQKSHNMLSPELPKCGPTCFSLLAALPACLPGVSAAPWWQSVKVTDGRMKSACSLSWFTIKLLALLVCMQVELPSPQLYRPFPSPVLRMTAENGECFHNFQRDLSFWVAVFPLHSSEKKGNKIFESPVEYHKCIFTPLWSGFLDVYKYISLFCIFKIDLDKEFDRKTRDGRPWKVKDTSGEIFMNVTVYQPITIVRRRC